MADVGNLEGKNIVPEHIEAIFDSMSYDELMNVRVDIHNMSVFLMAQCWEVLTVGLSGCLASIGNDNFLVLKQWLGLNDEDIATFDIDEFAKKIIALKGFVDRKATELYSRASETGHAGYVTKFVGLDTGRPEEAVSFDRGALDGFFASLDGSGPMPESPSLKVSDFPDAKEGDVIAEGVVHFTIMGTRPGLMCDCEYLKTDDGREYFDNDLFRTGDFYQKRVRLIRSGDGFRVEAVK